MALSIKPIGSNMTELHFSGGVVLFSYETPVAAVIKDTRYRTDKKWSATTSRHINKWLQGLPQEDKPQVFFDNLVSGFNLPELLG